MSSRRQVEDIDGGHLAAGPLLGLLLLAVALLSIASASASAKSTSAAGVQLRHSAGSASKRQAAATASDFSGSQLITFGEYGEGTPISDQYEAQGVLFSESEEGYPYIAWDGVAPENPVLSGTPTFYGPIHAQFVLAGTVIPATVNGMQLDVGYIDDPGSIKLTVNTNTGNEEIPAEEFGFNTLTSDASDITGFSVEATGLEEAGFEIDNLSFTPAQPPPQPTGPPSTYCGTAPTWLGKLIKGVECIIKAPVVQCGASLLFSKAEKAFELGKATKLARPVAKLYKDLAQIYGHRYFGAAPVGYRSFKELKATYDRASAMLQIVEVIPALKTAIEQKRLRLIAEDLADIIGVKSCVQAAVQLAHG